MMDLFLADSDDTPLPPSEVRIREFRVEPWPDGRRVRVVLEVDPFLKRPCADVVIWNAAGNVVAEVTIIEPITRKLELNMHLREANPSGVYRAQAVLYYQTLPESQDGEQSPAEPTPPEQVDCKEIEFEINP